MYVVIYPGGQAGLCMSLQEICKLSYFRSTLFNSNMALSTLTDYNNFS